MKTGIVRELLTDAGRISFPRWSPDGRTIDALAYHPGKSPVYRIDVESGKSAIIWGDLPSLWLLSWPVWTSSPDGKFFYQQSAPELLVECEIATGQKKQIPIPWNNHTTVLSPNCQQIAFSVERNSEKSVSTLIKVASVNGGEARLLTEFAGTEDRGLGWTPDNRYVLFVKETLNNSKMRELWRVPAAGGEAENLGVEMSGLRTPVVSSDGGWLAFVAGEIKTELWSMENFLPRDKAAAK